MKLSISTTSYRPLGVLHPPSCLTARQHVTMPLTSNPHRDPSIIAIQPVTKDASLHRHDNHTFDAAAAGILPTKEGRLVTSD